MENQRLETKTPVMELEFNEDNKRDKYTKENIIKHEHHVRRRSGSIDLESILHQNNKNNKTKNTATTTTTTTTTATTTTATTPGNGNNNGKIIDHSKLFSPATSRKLFSTEPISLQDSPIRKLAHSRVKFKSRNS